MVCFALDFLSLAHFCAYLPCYVGAVVCRRYAELVFVACASGFLAAVGFGEPVGWTDERRLRVDVVGALLLAGADGTLIERCRAGVA